MNKPSKQAFSKLEQAIVDKILRNSDSSKTADDLNRNLGEETTLSDYLINRIRGLLAGNYVQEDTRTLITGLLNFALASKNVEFKNFLLPHLIEIAIDSETLLSLNPF